MWTMLLGRLFQAMLATPASTTGKKEVTHSSLLSPAVSHTINVHTVLTKLISCNLSSSCGSDGSRNCLVSTEWWVLLFLQQFSISYLPTLQYTYTQCPTGCPPGYRQTSLPPPPPGTCCPTPVCEPIICTVDGVGYLEGENVPSHICETWYECYTVGSCSDNWRYRNT